MIRAMPYKESRIEHFKAVREKRAKTLHWWKYQKPITGEKEGKMTREEAAKKWEWVVENFNDSAFYLWPDERQKLIESISLLRNPIPDPITGLVPCGCGGSAVLDGAYGDDEVESSYRTEIYCEQCLIRTPIYTEDEQAKAAWNRAMGYKGGAE